MLEDCDEFFESIAPRMAIWKIELISACTITGTSDRAIHLHPDACHVKLRIGFTKKIARRVRLSKDW